ncbi:MAG: lysine--tRNA ligase, partial [Patescibacteria group bacterium]
MLEELIAERLKKLSKIKTAGLNAYPARVKRSARIGDVLAKFDALSRAKKKVSLAGRVMSMRDQGGVVFADVRDESGQIQVVLKKDNLDSFDFLKEVLDRGDFISIGGQLFITKKGEKSVEAKEAKLVVKSLRPLPAEWYGLEETETRLRQRYLDLLLNPGIRDMFRRKALFWNAFRTYLRKLGFLEVEMPALEAIPGGAEAEPFQTHHNALDTDFYLRISLELPLKKLLVGGYESVFEIGRVFRNEGIDREHLQDYNQLEFYWAYHDYNDLMELIEKMYKYVVKEITGGLNTSLDGKKINWGKKWPRIDYVEIFKKENGIDPLAVSRDELFRLAERLNLSPEGNMGKGRLIDLIYKKTVRPKLIQPCFLIHHPKLVSPLAKAKADNPNLTERIQVLVGGTELGNGWSELNDPLDQRARFEEQVRLRAEGDTEAMMLDEDFLTALEYGMPPAAGFGLSERFFAILMDKPIRETV